MPDVNIRDRDGRTYSVSEDQAQALVSGGQGWTLETPDAAVARASQERREDIYGGVAGKVAAGAAGAFRAATLGLSDAAYRAAGAEEGVRTVTEVNPGAALAGELVGGIATGRPGLATPAGAAASLGARVARTGESASAAARIGRAVAGGAVEGALTGVGDAVSELALSDKPIDAERIGSVLSSRMLFGGAIGGAAGGLGKVAEIGLAKAKGVIDEAAADGVARARAVGAADDLANLDAAGLSAARKTEVASFKTAEKAELEAIEAARVAGRSQLADDIIAFRREVKSQNHFLTTKDVDLPAVGEKLGAKELSRKAVQANGQLDRILDNPIGLAKSPAKALDALQRQEDALAKLLDRADDLRPLFAADTSGKRMAALDTIAPALEKNRALQQRIADLAAPPSSAKLTQLAEANAARIAAIDEAKDALAANAARPKTLLENVTGGAAFGVAAGAASAIPFVGSVIAPFVGAKAAGFVGEKVFGRLAKAGQEAAARSAKAVDAFIDVTRKATPFAPSAATRVLSHVAFSGEAVEAAQVAKDSHRERLAPLFQARTAEIRSQVSTGPDGRAQMRPEARQAVADRLSPIAAFNPVLADQLETLAARRIEFLANKEPKRPDIAGMPIGPDIWQPSDMQMRQWARYVAAVEDPGGIEERLADGTVTPEDAEVMREVYPERMQAITMAIIAKLGTLRQQLPYHRRIALSVFSGVPVDSAMDPRVLKALQASFKDEPGAQGGIAPPKTAPQFGSVRAEKSTPAQGRAQGAA